MRKNKEKGEFPPDIELLIAANGKSMECFYMLSQEERQKILDTISKTNEIIQDKT